MTEKMEDRKMFVFCFVGDFIGFIFLSYIFLSSALSAKRFRRQKNACRLLRIIIIDFSDFIFLS
jgi:hypothetical protein